MEAPVLVLLYEHGMECRTGSPTSAVSTPPFPSPTQIKTKKVAKTNTQKVQGLTGPRKQDGSGRTERGGDRYHSESLSRPQSSGPGLSITNLFATILWGAPPSSRDTSHTRGRTLRTQVEVSTHVAPGWGVREECPTTTEPRQLCVHCRSCHYRHKGGSRQRVLVCLRGRCRLYVCGGTGKAYYGEDVSVGVRYAWMGAGGVCLVASALVDPRSVRVCQSMQAHGSCLYTSERVPYSFACESMEVHVCLCARTCPLGVCAWTSGLGKERTRSLPSGVSRTPGRLVGTPDRVSGGLFGTLPL